MPNAARIWQASAMLLVGRSNVGWAGQCPVTGAATTASARTLNPDRVGADDAALNAERAASICLCPQGRFLFAV